MSEPCPPAFMRTAPPTDPGTPTAHDSPDHPPSATRRASTGRATAAPARTAPVPSLRSTSADPDPDPTDPDPDWGSSTPAKPAPRCTTIPSNPSSATNRLEPRPRTKTAGGAPSAAAVSRSAERTASRSSGASTST